MWSFLSNNMYIMCFFLCSFPLQAHREGASQLALARAGYTPGVTSSLQSTIDHSISCSKVPRQCPEGVLAPPKLPAHFPSFVHKWGFNQEPSTSQPIQTELSPPPGKKKPKKIPTLWWLTANHNCDDNYAFVKVAE